MGTKIPVQVLTDHANLVYFRKPQKLNRQQARWVTELADYHYDLIHVPGKTHTKPDIVSRRPDFKEGIEDDNSDVVLLPDHLFVNATTWKMEDLRTDYLE